MDEYTNHTHYNSIITVAIQSTSDPDGAVEIGVEGNYAKLAGSVGHHDYLVGGGKKLRLTEGTVATFVAIRNAP